MRASDVRRVIAEKQQRQDARIESHESQLNNTSHALSLYYSELYRSAQADIPAALSMLNRKAAEWKNLADAKPEDRSLQIWKLEYYQKYAIPFSCIPFVILAFPLGLAAKRSGRAVGFFIGLLLTSFYWALLVLGRSLGLRSDVSPFLVMGLPNILLLALGLVLYVRKGAA